MPKYIVLRDCHHKGVFYKASEIVDLSESDAEGTRHLALADGPIPADSAKPADVPLPGQGRRKPQGVPPQKGLRAGGPGLGSEIGALSDLNPPQIQTE